jgi:hypothetical protein
VSGPVQNTPFVRELATEKHRYNAFYNVGGNRIYIANLEYAPSQCSIITIY